VDRVFHVFASLFRTLCETQPFVGGDHNNPCGPYNLHLSALRKRFEDELWSLQQTVPDPAEDIPDPALRSRQFLTNITQATKETLLDQLKLPKREAAASTALILQRFQQYYHQQQLAHEEATQKLNSTAMRRTVRDIFPANSGGPKREFQPVASDACAGTNVLLSPSPEHAPDIITFGVPTGTRAARNEQQARLRYNHFHGLGAALAHEVLCHCVIQGQFASQMECVRNELYISHGWVAYFAFVTEELNMLTVLGSQTRFHSSAAADVYRMLLNNLEDDESRAGFEAAHSFFRSLADPSFTTKLQEWRDDRPRYTDSWIAEFAYAVKHM